MSRYISLTLSLGAISLGAISPIVAQQPAGPASSVADARSASTDGSSREQAALLLERARQAMSEGNWETADSLITRAEALNVSYALFHTGDTPQKARRDFIRSRPKSDEAPAAAATPQASSNPQPTREFPAMPLTSLPPGIDPKTRTAALGGQPQTVTPPTAPYPAADTYSAGELSVTPGTPSYPTTDAAASTAAPPQNAPTTVIPLPAVGGSDIRLVGNLEAVPSTSPSAANPSANAADGARLQTLEFVRQARAALAAGDLEQAEVLARRADALNVPDKQFGTQDDRAWLVLLEVQKRRRAGTTTTAPAATSPQSYPGAQAIYDANNDPTRNVPASAEQSASPAPAAVEGPRLAAFDAPAAELIDAGDAALRGNEREAALALYRQAEMRRDELSPADQQRLQDRLTLTSSNEPIAPGRPEPRSLLGQTAQAQDVLARQVMADIAKLEAQAKQAQGTDPGEAQALLHQARVLVEKSGLNTAAKEMLIRRVDRDLAELDKFVAANRPQIELAQRNREVKDQIDREQAQKLANQERLAKMVEEYNLLVDQQRFAEAEVVAKRAADIAPNEPIAVQLQAQSKALRRMFNNSEIFNAKEDGFVGVMTDGERSMAPFVGPYELPKNWIDLTKNRGPLLTGAARKSPKELEIEQKLKTPVSLKFDKATFSQVFEKLSAVTGVPIYLDQRGLAAEGIDSNTPVTIDLSAEISLRSALNLILAEHHLTYLVRDEVLKITSDRMRSEDVYTVSYPVGDLVIPIPNFVPTNRIGLAGALADAQSQLGGGFAGMVAANGSSPVAPSIGSASDASVLAQVNVPFYAGGGGGPSTAGPPQNIQFGPNSGPGGVGAGVRPDFDSLIELITSTIRQQDWQENGGTVGFIKPHVTTLSLVITHDARGHEEIESLLAQLRKLQDLQVTIEVRFIRLNDNFYEQIAVDFDFDINDNADKPFQIFGRPNLTGQANRTQFQTQNATTGGFPFAPVNAGNPQRDVQDRDLRGNQAVTVGLQAPGVFSGDLDIPFNQSSAQNSLVTLPGLANYGAGGASVGFAILSDLEAFFFINAVQDDTRTNVLQAPKVTMFNGQQAYVADTSQTPFVISVDPVVGDFAAAQRPVIVVLNEGTSMSVQAVVSNDRRFVRLTLVPFFSQIGDVNTFTFEGTSSTTRSSSSDTQGPGTESKSDGQTTTNTGTTVQLPTFAFQTVTTTVSVPDGGTVLLGGIKRMAETRHENGVPLLNKLPYINRLFDNVGIAKTSESLMMMVTPRIIIQEEEEAAIGVTGSP